MSTTAMSITDDQMRDGLKAVVNDAAATLCCQIDAASDRAALQEIGARISSLPAMLTRAEKMPSVTPPPPPPNRSAP